MRAVMLVGVVVACGPGLKQPETQDIGREALADAAGDPAAMERLLDGLVVNGGLWFDDPACSKQFGEPGDVGPAALPAFARCLAMLRMQRSVREDALGDVVVMTYAPGIEVEARVVRELSGPRLTWIGYVSRRDAHDSQPTITPDALERLRVTGDRNGPLDPVVASGLELDETPKVHAAYTWIKACIDDTGAVITAHSHETTSVRASNAFVAAVKGWTFRPFTIQGQAIPVCSMVRLAYPPGAALGAEIIPLPPPPSKGKWERVVLAPGSKLTEGRRIAGTREVAPDDSTRTQMQKAHVSRIVGSFRVCIDETGHVESVLPFRSTGYAPYDRKILATIQTWRYSLYQVDDQPVPVCTSVTFIYTQR